MRKTLIQNTMKKFMLTIILMVIILMFPVKSNSFEFYGGLHRVPVNDSVTVTWDAQENTIGYQLKIIHFFYTGLETEIVETFNTSYTFSNLPKSSRHFEIQVRAYNENTDGARLYSDWSSSTNTACSIKVNCIDHASITQTGLLMTHEIETDQPCQITMNYEEGGITRTDNFDITIMNYTSPTKIIIDNGDIGTESTGFWNRSSGINPYGGASGSLTTMTPDTTYTSETPIANDYYTVSLWWTYYASRCTSVPVDIYDGSNLLDTVEVNHQENGGQWNTIGSYFFQTGTARIVIRSTSNTCSTCADAVSFNTAIPPKLDYIVVNGAANANEASNTQYTCTAHYLGGASRVVEPNSCSGWLIYTYTGAPNW